MVPVIMKTSKEAFSPNDILLDFLRGSWGEGGKGGVKILYHNILAHTWISTGYHK